jgi:myo-inositol-1(or 4)-monophosphatase
VTDWVAICRAAVEDVKAVLVELPTRVEREPVAKQGVGGDETTAIDQAAEDAILARFAGLDVTVVSEEIGRYGNGKTLVVVDPIDGSLNAKRGIPYFALSIAFADGETMQDVFLGYVYDFGTNEEWIGRRGEGATLNGEPLGGVRPKDTIAHAHAVDGLAHRLRVMGSLALSLCHLAAGRIDGVCSLKEARSVDIAAAQLLCHEVGLSVALFDDPRAFGEAELDLTGRSRIAAAGNDELCTKLAAALSS